ncbi:MAG: LppM family (lipo)protein [Egibacteraceae bacterium]
MTSTLLRAVLLAVLALGITGCQLRVGVGVDVDRNGAGVLAVSVGADKELLTKAKEAGADPLGVLLAQSGQLAEAGWRVTEDTPVGGGRELRLSARFRSPEEFNALASDLAGALAAPEVRLLEPLTLEVTDDRITVTGAAGMQPADVITELGVQPADAVRLADEEAAVAYEVRVRLPGDVRSSTATTQDQGTLVWEIRPGQQVEVRAVGTRPSRPLLPVLAVVAEALAAAGVAVAAALRRRQRQRGRTGA